MTPDQALSLANDISCAIATLQAVADELTTAYPDSDYYESKSAPEPQKPINLEQLRGVLADISRNGKTAAVKELLGKYGANKLSEIPPEHYAELLSDAEGIT